MSPTLESLERRTLLSSVPVLSLDGGGSPSAAADIGRISGQVQIEDHLAVGESADYFRFSVKFGGNVYLNLSGLTSAADLVLLNSRGQTIATSTRSGARADYLSVSLKRGTYTVGVFRGAGAASVGVDTPYTLLLQADLNYGSIVIDGQTFTLGLIRADGTAAPISSSTETWVATHGWLGSPASVHPLATAIDAASRHNQVLELDWSGPAADANILTAIGRVPAVGAWAAAKLNSWGIPGGVLNLIGHSMGGYMTDQIAQRISGGAGVDRIVALDPATPEAGGIDFSGTDFAAHSQFSLAFIGSDFSSPSAAATADETIKLNVGPSSDITTHMAVLDLFTGITQENLTSSPGAISPLFSLRSLHSGSRPGWAANSIDGEYEALLTGQSTGGGWSPSVLTYRSTRLNKFVSIVA